MPVQPATDIEMLVSTMNMESAGIIADMNMSCDSLVINQCGAESSRELRVNGNKVRIWDSAEKGLSRSRNLALKLAIGEICFLADDDVRYVDDLELHTRRAYEMLPDAHIIIFNFETNVPWRKKRLGNKVKKLNYLDCLKVASIMISFKRASITRAGIVFNNNFGAGSEFPSGEENIFLFDCLEQGLKIYYYPVVIASVQYDKTSWFTSFNEQYFRGKGALGYMLFRRYYMLFVLQFALRKYTLYRHHTGFFAAVRYMIKGRQYCGALLNVGHGKD